MTLANLYLILHLVGLVVGLGAATVADLMSIQALRSGMFSKERAQMLKMLGNLVWVGLFLLVASGVLLVVSYQTGGALHLSDKLLAKLVFTGVIALNGLVIHRAVMPAILEASGKPIVDTKLPSLVILFSATAAISLTSWWSTFLLGAWRRMPYELPVILAGYVALLGLNFFVMTLVTARLMRQNLTSSTSSRRTEA